MSQLDAVRVDSVRVESICLDSVHAEQAPGESVGDRPAALPLFPLQSAVEDGVCLDLKLTLGDYQSLLDELTQAQALDQERVVRIFHLEQALDQALSCLEEMRLQLHDQAILEGQLAATEEYASVQQQAIARFKLQIAEQQAALDAQILETQQRDQAIQELLATIEAMTQAQQQEIERLRLKLSHDQQEAQTHRSRIGKQFQDFQVALESRQNRVAELEAETLAARMLTTSLQGQLETSQQQIRELSTSLRQYRASLAQLEAQIEQTHIVLEERQNGATRFQRRPTASAEPVSVTVLQQDLAKALRQVEALEEQLAQQTIQQTRLQQSHQELEADRDRLLAHETTQDQQIAEMQEQILQQAQHVTEHETAIQYWKDRYATSQRQITHMKDLVEHSLSELAIDDEASNVVLSDLITAIQTIQPAMPPEHLELLPIALPLPRLGTVELPNFLVRRRAQARDQTKG